MMHRKDMVLYGKVIQTSITNLNYLIIIVCTSSKNENTVKPIIAYSMGKNQLRIKILCIELPWNYHEIAMKSP